MDPPVHFWQKKMDRGVHFFLPKVGGPFFSAKSGPALPKVDLVHFVKKKVDPVQFWQGKKVDLVQTGPFLAGEKSGPGPVSPSNSKQVHFWQGKKVDPVQFRCQNPGRSIFGRGKKWTRSSFAVKIQAGPFLAGEKSGPGPVSCRNPGRSIFGRGKKWTRSSFLPKSRQVHFWQGKKVDPVQFPAEIQAGPFLAGEKSGLGPVSCRNPGRSIFGRGKKWTRFQFRCRNPSRSIFGRGKQWTWSSFAAEI